MALSKKKKKNAITLGVLLASLAVLLVLYFVVVNGKEEKKNPDETENQEKITIYSVPSTELTAFAVNGSRSFSFTIEKTGNALALAGDDEFSLDTARIDQMMEQMVEINADKIVLENATDLEEFGLGSTGTVLMAELTDGSVKKMTFGDRSTVEGGYYASNGDGNVYMVDAEVYSMFAVELKDIFEEDVLPTYEKEFGTGLKVDSDIYPEIYIGETDQVDLTTKNLYPFVMQKAYDAPVLVDTEAFYAVMANYCDLKLGDMISYHKADLATYGLDQPKTALSLWYLIQETMERKEYTIYFGNADESGENVYIRLDGSNQVFMMDKAKADSLFAIEPFPLVCTYTNLVSISVLDRLVISYGTSRHLAELEHETVLEDDREKIKDYITFNGNALVDDADKAFREIYQKLIILKLTRELTAEDRISDDEVLSMEFTEYDTGAVVKSVKYYKLEGNDTEYAICMDGAFLFAADAAEIQRFLNEWKEYVK